ncbi:MAG: hypothetical protein ACI97A_002384 [Planctomycetota bacterium]|jgi:hypothetical protein
MPNLRSQVSTLNSIISAIIVCLVIDLTALLLESAPSWDALAHVLWTTLMWSTIVAASCVYTFVGLLRLATWLQEEKHFPRITRSIVPAIPISWLFYVLSGELMLGQGFSLMAGAEKIRIGAKIGSILGPVFMVWLLMRSQKKIVGKKSPLVVMVETSLGVMAIVFLCFVDATVYPQLYRAAHLIIWMGVLAVVFVWRARFESRQNTGKSRLTIVKAGILVFLATAAVWANSLSDSQVRRMAWRDTLFLKRALMHLVPARERAITEVDPQILAELSHFKTMSAEDLDRILPNRRQTNVIMISIDALRADRVGRQEYRRNLTPNLDDLAAKSADFTNAWTCCPATLPSFSATLRSTVWLHNDVNKDRQKKKIPVSNRQALLPVEMQSLGFHTEAILGVRFPFVVKRLSVGFDRFNVEGRSDVQSAERVTDYGLAAIDQKREGPLFLWLHYFDPHSPYAGYGSENFGSTSLDLYDAEIAYVDRELGRFFDGLKARGLDQDTVIILFSDHGEDWDKSGNPIHANNVTETQIHIPFLIHIPGIEAHQITSAVSNIDIMPTILELSGGHKTDTCQGRSLLRFVLFGEPKEADRGNYPEAVAYSESFEGSRMIAARRGNMKLVYDVEADVYTLYKLSQDPKNRETAAPDDEAILQDLKKLLSAFESGK